jgi:hypothetical protein
MQISKSTSRGAYPSYRAIKVMPGKEADLIIEGELKSLRMIYEADMAALVELEGRRLRCICTDCDGRVEHNRRLQELRDRIAHTKETAFGLLNLPTGTWSLKR